MAIARDQRPQGGVLSRATARLMTRKGARERRPMDGRNRTAKGPRGGREI